jgi:hypothetical protein
MFLETAFAGLMIYGLRCGSDERAKHMKIQAAITTSFKVLCCEQCCMHAAHDVHCQGTQLQPTAPAPTSAYVPAGQHRVTETVGRFVKAVRTCQSSFHVAAATQKFSTKAATSKARQPYTGSSGNS